MRIPTAEERAAETETPPRQAGAVEGRTGPVRAPGAQVGDAAATGTRRGRVARSSSVLESWSASV